MSSLDLLREDAIRSSLSFNLKDLPIFVYDEIDSTNNEAKRKVISDNLGHALYVADKQTAGRGRSGHSFYSPSSTGVYFTYTFTPSAGISSATHVTTKAGVCVAKAIEELQKEFDSQIVFSAKNLLRKYHGDENHAECVRMIATRLFASLKDEITLDEHAQILLETAAILHDIGVFIKFSNLVLDLRVKRSFCFCFNKAIEFL